MTWLDRSESRIGLGCMRLGALGRETIVAAAEAGVTVFDTARAYGESERLLAETLRGSRARIVTKGGMSRAGGGWVPDGRARTIRADCETSLEALGGLQIDLYLLHAPDPRTPWLTSVRALQRLLDEGLVRRIGVCNVSRDRLDEAAGVAQLSAVQLPLSPFDESALRGGVVDRCNELGLAVIAHSPLGGPRRAGRLTTNVILAEVAAAHGASAQEAALAWLLALSDRIVPIPGARRPETARSIARAGVLELADDERARLAEAFGGGRRERRVPRPAAGEVVLVMGIPGAGKSRLAATYAARGYMRLNRDEVGGSLRALAGRLEAELANGACRAVLDNTYLTRASRSYVLDAASRHALPVRCVWLDTPPAQAQVNMVERLLERCGSLPGPAELRRLARREPGLLAPTSQMRAYRELEPPGLEEGFVAVERLEFERAPSDGRRPGVFVSAAAAAERSEDPGAPHLVFDWDPDGSEARLRTAVSRLSETATGPVEGSLCPHPAGPPVCWCRPPLPGLVLAFARTHGVDPRCSVLVGSSPAHRTLAAAVGARYVPG